MPPAGRKIVGDGFEHVDTADPRQAVTPTGVARSSIAVVLAVVLALTGCATRLAPAPEAFVLPGPPGAALGESADVRIVARVNAWSGVPGDLPVIVTPIFVMIDNASSVPLAVRHKQLALDADTGQRFAALPPVAITGTGTQAVPVASIGWYPPPYRRYHGVLNETYRSDPVLHRWVDLPSADMVQQALPDAVIPPGGRASGFLYFERVRDARRVTFRAALVNAQTGARFGEITIPFVVD